MQRRRWRLTENPTLCEGARGANRTAIPLVAPEPDRSVRRVEGALTVPPRVWAVPPVLPQFELP